MNKCEQCGEINSVNETNDMCSVCEHIQGTPQVLGDLADQMKYKDTIKEGKEFFDKIESLYQTHPEKVIFQDIKNRFIYHFLAKTL